MRILLIILGIFTLLFALNWFFPYVPHSSDGQMHIVYLVCILTLILAGSARLRREHLPKMALQAGMWLCIFVVLILGYSMKDRLLGELLPNRIHTGAGGEMTVRRSADGHFHIAAKVNGAAVDFLVDTGASEIVLSPADARRAGFDPESLRYNRVSETANGTGSGAGVSAKSLAIGEMTLRDVPMVVNKAEMNGSLLGMYFLEQLQSYHVTGNTLTLTP